MPTYTMRQKETGETVDHIFSLSEREEFLKVNPDWEQVIKASPLVSQHGSNISKTDGGWKEVLDRVKSGSSKTNTIKT